MINTKRILQNAFSFMLILTFMLGLSPAAAQDIAEKPQQVVKSDLTIVDDGMVMIVMEEKELAEIRHILDYLLQNARDHAAAGEFEQASQEIGLAASYMHLDARSSNSKSAEDILKAADQLTTIARATDYAKTPVGVYDSAIFDAHRALANHHQQRAESFIGAEFNRSTGYALEAALVHYRSAAMSWARIKGMPVEQIVDEDLLNGVEKFALAMREGRQVVERDADVLTRRLGIAIQELTSAS